MNHNDTFLSCNQLQLLSPFLSIAAPHHLDSPYDEDCSTCNTCIGENGTKEEDCVRYDCVLEDIGMPEFPVENT